MLDIETLDNVVTQPAFKSKLVRGDCLKVMSRLPENQKFDVIIADPPYNIGKDFGNDTDCRTIDEYLKWTNQWLSRCFELLADNGVIYIYGYPEILARISAQYPIEEQRWLVWHYTNKAVPSSKFWQRSHESIICFWNPRQKRPTLEVEQIREPYTDSYKANIGKVRASTVSRFGGNRGGGNSIQGFWGGFATRCHKSSRLSWGSRGI